MDFVRFKNVCYWKYAPRTQGKACFWILGERSGWRDKFGDALPTDDIRRLHLDPLAQGVRKIEAWALHTQHSKSGRIFVSGMFFVTKIKVDRYCDTAKQEHGFLSSQYYTSKGDFYVAQGKAWSILIFYNIFYIEPGIGETLIGYQMLEKKCGLEWNILE